MEYLIEIPVDGGGVLHVQADEAEVSGDLHLAAAGPNTLIAKASASLEHSLAEIQPALKTVMSRMASLGPEEVTVEFGMKLGAESGIVVAKGSGEVHFTVTLLWRRPAALDAERPS